MYSSPRLKLALAMEVTMPRMYLSRLRFFCLLLGLACGHGIVLQKPLMYEEREKMQNAKDEYEACQQEHPSEPKRCTDAKARYEAAWERYSSGGVQGGYSSHGSGAPWGRHDEER